MNKVDLIILAYLGLYTLLNFRRGFLALSFELVGLVAALSLALLIYPALADLVAHRFHLPVVFARAGSFLLLLTFGQLAVIIALRLFAYHLIPRDLREAPWNRWAGLAPALLKGLLVAAILTTIIAGLPLPSGLRSDLNRSQLAGPLVRQTSAIGDKIFGGAIKEALNFLTVEPKSEERIELGFTVSDVEVDEAAELRMFELLNQERSSKGLAPLIHDTGGLRDVARAHSRDMFARGYFSHQNPDGLSPFDRMHRAAIDFAAAGENLALAPDVEIAHRGLMNSPPHRENILEPDFRRVGIGAIRGGLHGEMFTQNFTD